MAETVLLSTHDLPVAGLLREGFRGAGYAVDLVTPDEDISGADDPVLLVLTGGIHDGTATSLAHQARSHFAVPVFGILPDSGAASKEAATALGMEEAFLRGADPDEVVLIGRTVIERRRLQQITGIIGQSDAILQALERVARIAPVNSTVLVTGESGTGKELVARGIHGLSSRRHKRFIAVNVAALPDTLLESELFGHEKGAFTGAIDRRRGFFELADGGTILLDEIGEMPLATQVKLLRVLEQRELQRVGGEAPIRVDVRVVAATNRDLLKWVGAGEFRRDLYYRLNVLHIELPPLRERKGDIPLLVRAFVKEISERHERPFAGISAEAMDVLARYSWPGNVRELRNMVESMVVLGQGMEIRPEDIPDAIRFRTDEAALLPATIGSMALSTAPTGVGAARPELEFIFRTLVELRVDMDELRREFDVYQQGDDGATHRSEAPAAQLVHPGPRGALEIHVGRGTPTQELDPFEPRVHDLRRREIEVAATVPGSGAGQAAGPSADPAVVWRPGMTMDEMERLAIAAALRETGGNRRKAAEQLGIGERTLYRKIQKFDIEA